MSFRGSLLTLFLILLPLSGASLNAQTMTRAQSIEHEKQAIRELVARYGGYEMIEEKLVPFQEEAGKIFSADRNRPQVGKNKFSSGISASALKNVWSVEPTGDGKQDPKQVIIDFDRELRKIGVQLIMVPVPGKIEAYPGEFQTPLPPGMPVSTGRLKAQLQLLEADVETIDILEPFLRNQSGEDLPLYELSGHHPSGLGAKIAGELIGERLKRFNFPGADPSRFKATRRNAAERIDNKVPMIAWEVTYADGTPYEHSGDSPIIVTGDSHAFAYGRASWASHIARVTGLPVTDISVSGGGPTGGQRVADLGLENLRHRKLVIWIFTSSNLERFPWDPVRFSEQPSLAGLITLNRVEEALEAYSRLKKTSPERVDINENTLNNLGYQLMGAGKQEQALGVFKINTLEFPNSANAWDSMGEGYVRAGRNDEAIPCFQKALSLYPAANVKANSTKYLQQLGAEIVEPEPYQLSEKAIEPLVGEYEFSKEIKATVFKENGQLCLDVTGQPRFVLQPLSDTAFITRDGISISFDQIESGHAEKMVAIVNGRPRNAVRQEKTM